MKQTINKALKKPDSSLVNIFGHHASIRPVLDHELPRTITDKADTRGWNFSQMPSNSTASANVHANLIQSVPFTPEYSLLGGGCHRYPPCLQAKLTIGKSGDEYEQEADRVAEQVMRIPEPQVQRKGCPSPNCKEEDEDKILLAKSVGSAGTVPVQIDHPQQLRIGSVDRSGGHLESGATLQTKLEIGESSNRYEREADSIAEQVLSISAEHELGSRSPHIKHFLRSPIHNELLIPTSVKDVLVNSGRPMDSKLRDDMENRFGYNFSQVRLHTGPKAERSAKDINANAFTAGHQIVFGANTFLPSTQNGMRLIAHELTHVIQQSGTDATRFKDKKLIHVPAFSYRNIQLDLTKYHTIKEIALEKRKALEIINDAINNDPDKNRYGMWPNPLALKLPVTSFPGQDRAETGGVYYDPDFLDKVSVTETISHPDPNVRAKKGWKCWIKLGPKTLYYQNQKKRAIDSDPPIHQNEDPYIQSALYHEYQHFIQQYLCRYPPIHGIPPEERDIREEMFDPVALAQSNAEVEAYSKQIAAYGNKLSDKNLKDQLIILSGFLDGPFVSELHCKRAIEYIYESFVHNSRNRTRLLNILCELRLSPNQKLHRLQNALRISKLNDRALPQVPSVGHVPAHPNLHL